MVGEQRARAPRAPRARRRCSARRRAARSPSTSRPAIHRGASSERNAAVPRPTGTTMTMATSVVTTVPTSEDARAVLVGRRVPGARPQKADPRMRESLARVDGDADHETGQHRRENSRRPPAQSRVGAPVAPGEPALERLLDRRQAGDPRQGRHFENKGPPLGVCSSSSVCVARATTLAGKGVFARRLRRCRVRLEPQAAAFPRERARDDGATTGKIFLAIA